MFPAKKRFPLLVLVLIGVLTMVVGVVSAEQWSVYHWYRSDDAELVLDIGDCHSPTSRTNWSGLLSEVVANWNDIPNGGNSPYIGFRKTNCGGADIKSYNDDYGNTGWLGLATLSIGKGKGYHIRSAESQVNEYYVAYPGYYNFDEAIEWQHVLCQEIGHTFGVGHNRPGDSDGNYDNTCMNDVVFPLRYPTANKYEYDLLNSMYEHNHGNGGEQGQTCFSKGNKCKSNAGAAYANWAEHYESEEAMFASADAVVVAVVQSSGSAGTRGRGNVPFTQVHFKVEEVRKGDDSLNHGFNLRQTGGTEFEVEGDPLYVKGERYTLYLRDIGHGFYRTVSPQGRILLSG